MDTSPVPGDPQATIRKAQTVRQAALAPAEPSGQDQRAAASGGPEEALEAPEGALGPGGEGGEPQVLKALETGIGPEALGRQGGIGASKPGLEVDGGEEDSGMGAAVAPGAADADWPRMV